MCRAVWCALRITVCAALIYLCTCSAVRGAFRVKRYNPVSMRPCLIRTNVPGFQSGLLHPNPPCHATTACPPRTTHHTHLVGVVAAVAAAVAAARRGAARAAPDATRPCGTSGTSVGAGTTTGGSSCGRCGRTAASYTTSSCPRDR